MSMAAGPVVSMQTNPPLSNFFFFFLLCPNEPGCQEATPGLIFLRERRQQQLWGGVVIK